MHEEVQQVQEAWRLVPEVLAVLVALGVKVPTALVAMVVCTLVAVKVWLTLGVLELEGHLGCQEESVEVLLLNWVQCAGYRHQQVVPGDQTGVG